MAFAFQHSDEHLDWMHGLDGPFLVQQCSWFMGYISPPSCYRLQSAKQFWSVSKTTTSLPISSLTKNHNDHAAIQLMMIQRMCKLALKKIATFGEQIDDQTKTLEWNKNALNHFQLDKKSQCPNTADDWWYKERANQHWRKLHGEQIDDQSLK